MNLLNIPGLNGYKTAIGAWTQILGGLLYALAELLKLVTDCLNGATALDACFNNLPTLVMGVVVAANGLGQLGIGSKVENVKATVKP